MIDQQFVDDFKREIKNLILNAVSEIQPPKTKEEWLTSQQILTELQTTQQTLSKWYNEGLPFIEGRPRRVSRTELDKFLRNKQTQYDVRGRRDGGNKPHKGSSAKKFHSR